MSKSYPRSEHDKRLNALGYDLLEENREAVRLAGLKQGELVLDIATGSGHTRGNISAREIDEFLRVHFDVVEYHELALNSAWIVSGERGLPFHQS